MSQPIQLHKAVWDEWEVHRRQIYRQFVVERKSYAQVAAYMKDHHQFCKKPRDYEYRLKKWNHRQKLTESGWQWVGNILDQRAAEGKHSQVLLSGVQIPVDKVLQRRRFHRRPTLAERYSSEIVPLRQPEDMPVRIRTPPPLEVYQVPWPGELPWVQFNKQLGDLIPTQIHQIKSLSEEADNLEPVINSLLRLHISEDQVARQATTPSVLKISDFLDVISPELHEGDHTTTAELFWAGPRESASIELFRLMVYLISNNMELEIERLTGYRASGPLKLLDGLGLLTKRNIQILARSSGETNETFLRRLLGDAIARNKAEVLDWLLAESINPNSYIPYHCQYFGVSHLPMLNLNNYALSCCNLLQVATSYGSFACCSALLDAGADPNLGSPLPLELAAQIKSHGTAMQLFELLVSKGADKTGPLTIKSRPNLLLSAVAQGNITLAAWLLENDATIGPEAFIVAAQHADAETISFLYAEAVKSLDLDKVTLTVENMLPLETLLIAIDRNRFLLHHQQFPSLNTAISNLRDRRILGGLFEDKEVEVVGILHEVFRHKGLRGFGEITEARSLSWCPSPLHAAILNGFPRVVRLLLEAGADVNWPYQLYKTNKTLSPASRPTKASEEGTTTNISFNAAECWSATPSQYTRQMDTGGEDSPLSLALEIANAEISKIILLHRPKLVGHELAKAAKIGDVELINMLFEAGARVEGNEALYALMSRNPLAIDLFLRKGATNGTSVLEAALIIGNSQMISTALEEGVYDSVSLYEAVCLALRTNNTSVVERLLAHKPAAPRDEFEVAALAVAVINQNLQLSQMLITPKFLPGVWTTCLYQMTNPVKGKQWWYTNHHSDGIYEIEPRKLQVQKMAIVPYRGHRNVHILEFAVYFESQYPEARVVDTFMELGVSAEDLNLTYIIPFIDDSRLENLIKIGADVNKRLELESPLSMAIGSKPDLVKKLIQERAKVDDEFEYLINGGTLRYLLSFEYRNNAYKDDIGPGVEAGGTADVPNMGLHRTTLLQIATKNGDLHTINQLLEAGASINAAPFYMGGLTCLQTAVIEGYIGIVRVLLYKGAKVNAPRARFDGRTAIEAAALHGRLDIMRFLLLHLRDIDESEHHRIQYVRAVKFATSEGHITIADMLKEYIRWNDDDQASYSQIDLYEAEVVDEMTQELSEFEQQHLSQNPEYNSSDSDSDSTESGDWDSDLDSDPENDAFELANEEVLDSNHDAGDTTSFDDPDLAETMNPGYLTSEVENLEDIPGDTFFGVGHEDMMRDLHNEGFLV